jgi:phage tail tube protein FII
MNKKPTVYARAEIYIDGGTRQLGTANTTLPPEEALTETLRGGGLMGEYNAAVPGMFSAREMVMNFSAFFGDIENYAVGETHNFDVRAALQVVDPTTHQTEYVQVRHAIVGTITARTPGEVGSVVQAGASISVSVRREEKYSAGKLVKEWDILNDVYRVNGRDVYAGIRAAIS